MTIEIAILKQRITNIERDRHFLERDYSTATIGKKIQEIEDEIQRLTR